MKNFASSVWGLVWRIAIISALVAVLKVVVSL